MKNFGKIRSIAKNCMYRTFRKLTDFHIFIFFLFTSVSIGFWGCLASGDANELAATASPFPRPLGEWIIPLDKGPASFYRHTYTDTVGTITSSIPRFQIYMEPKGYNEWGYAVEKPDRGSLITFKESPWDSAGIYVIGYFVDTAKVYYDTAYMWFPQFPDEVKSWTPGPGHIMEYITSDTAYITEKLFDDDVITFNNEAGFQKHSAFLIKETAGDTVSYYYLRKGVGILGYEMSIGGHLRAIGTLCALYRNWNYDTYY